ncbi:Crp/Fnr family transcriptional regulator [Niabella beijingensis]|uniref:Crp/Fnr family transcriptional regulator n=1 Tax=Niabella beijingensis TaxID=2872700 RepID=UPI001CC12682|nr:Crp/Fnr family transcriptional regulator [Niabella beijingensis]MBZ4191877.1 Crp/Fnr family transcriptional regulator [Niabella beijingensis]
MNATLTDIDDFILFLRQFVVLSPEEVKNILLPAIELREFNKRDVVTRAGEIEEYMNFIKSGTLRKYYVQDKDEIIVQISIEGHLISSQESFYTRTPSEYFIDAVEPTAVLSLRYDALERIFAASHTLERLGRLVTEHTMVLKDKWQFSLIRQTPRERFLNFVEKYPEILQRVPQKYLASYLNIKPETFSRFKHLTRQKHHSSDEK